MVRIGIALAVFVLVLPSTASAIELWPFHGQDDRVLDDLRKAREANELDLASALLEELQTLRPAADLDVALETARLMIARGGLEDGATKLASVADLYPMSPAREELAAVQVRLGRWPEAVGSLRQAFDERAGGLGAAQMRDDPRFAELREFKPFETLLDETREAQAGPLGRVFIRLERLEAAVEESINALDRLSDVLVLVARVATSFFVPLAAFMVLGLLATAGSAQLGVVGQPWTLITGFIAASATWILGSRRMTGGASLGLETVALGSGLVMGTWIMLTAAASIARAWRHRSRFDPWDAEHRAKTEALVENLRSALLGPSNDVAELKRCSHRLVAQLRGQAFETPSSPETKPSSLESDDSTHHHGALR